MDSSFLVYTLPNAADGEGGSHILLHPERSNWVRVNDTGLKIARALDAGASEEDVAAHLATSYRISEERARGDVSYVSGELGKACFFTRTGLKTSLKRPLKSLFFHLTERCNLACRHCYVSCPEHAGKRAKDLETAAVLRCIEELAEQGGRSVTLSGGEPLLHPELKKILIRCAPQVSVNLLTNGTLIDREWADFLADLEVGVHVQISVDGSRAEIHDAQRGKGSFDRALRAVDHLQRAGLGEKLNFCTTLMTQNLHDLKAIIHLTERLKVPLVRFLPLRHKGSAREAWDSIGSGIDVKDHEAFYRETAELEDSGACAVEVSCGLSGFILAIPEDAADDDLWCPIGKKLVVSATGDTYPCVLMMKDEYKLGNIYHDSLAALHDSRAMARLCITLINRRRKIERCSSCSWRNLCQAGCMGLALEQKGTVWDTDVFCDYRREAYEKAFARVLGLTSK